MIVAPTVTFVCGLALGARPGAIGARPRGAFWSARVWPGRDGHRAPPALRTERRGGDAQRAWHSERSRFVACHLSPTTIRTHSLPDC
jgi:hypothetical protein